MCFKTVLLVWELFLHLSLNNSLENHSGPGVLWDINILYPLIPSSLDIAGLLL